MYYLMNENNGSILDSFPIRPDRMALLSFADEFSCPVYLIEGSRIGYTAYPPQPPPVDAPDDGARVTFAELSPETEPTDAELREYGIDLQADEFADYRREEKYGKGL